MGHGSMGVAILALSAQGQNPSEISKNLRVSRQTVYRTLERGTATAPKRMRTKPGRPTETVEAVKIAINEKNAKATVRGLAREFNMPRTTMRRLVKDDLGLKSFKRTPRHALKSTDKEKRVAGAKKCLNQLKKKPKEVVILHLDETPFSLGEMVTMDTGFYIAEACGDADDTTVHYGKERHFANLQVIAVVGSDGQKCDLIFLEDGQRLNSFTYVEFLRRKVFPWARATYGESWWLQHDGASCHTSKFTQQFLRTEAPGFFPKEAWPPHSPDAAPMDYAIFGRLKSSL
ncbi:Uncharacterized protein FKW44_023659, partial [Caligus rogercresseyi]